MAREVVAEESTPAGTYRLEMVKCGKANCHSCPHGPYWYVYYRVGKRVVSKYIGKNRSGSSGGSTAPAAAKTTGDAGSSADDSAARNPETQSGDTVETRLLAACRALRAEDSSLVRLADLRRYLSNIPREELDAALDRMYRRQDINLTPLHNPQEHTPADIEAQMRIGGRDKHLISIAEWSDPGPDVT